jgi:hypothetical protein
VRHPRARFSEGVALVSAEYPAPDVLFAMNRAKVAKPGPEAPPIASLAGWNIHLSHSGTSYSCPGLRLHGYATLRQLVNAIRRKGYGVGAKVAKAYLP